MTICPGRRALCRRVLTNTKPPTRLCGFFYVHKFCNNTNRLRAVFLCLKGLHMPKISRLLRRPFVEERVGLRRSSLYAMIAAGTFPKPVQLSARSVAWREADVDAWIESRATKGGAQ